MIQPTTTVCGYPLKLEPQFVERVWGAENLELIYEARSKGLRRIGEVWLTGDSNRIANGALAGKTLHEATRLCGESLLGSRVAAHPSGQPVFPLLVKFLFTTDKLSVQVHPSDAYARANGSWGKTEMWHILRAEPGAQLAVGFREEARQTIFSRPGRLREAATTGRIEEWLAWQEVRAGETYFVPAGTVHAIGAGITLCEIQQNSDITYRLYDYTRPGTDGKPRPLHVEQALAVADSSGIAGRTTPFEWNAGAEKHSLLAACRHFLTERWEAAAGQTLRFPREEESPHLEIWICLAGTAEWEAGGERLSAMRGEVVVIPGAVTSYEIHPPSDVVLLRSFPPDWERDVALPLQAAGVPLEQLQGACFPVPEQATRVPR